MEKREEKEMGRSDDANDRSFENTRGEGMRF